MMNMKSIGQSLVFEVPIEQQRLAYLRIDRTQIDDEIFVVNCNADKFLNLWRNAPNTPHPELPRGSKSIWQADYKFQSAEEGFSKGIKNPVPLAEVYCGYIKRKRFLLSPKPDPFVDFSNGITRTIWLLANGARYFPVELNDISSAKLLAHYCSDDRSCKSVSEPFKLVTTESWSYGLMEKMDSSEILDYTR